MNFLRYPLTSQKFFLNQKNPHRAKFGHPKLSGEVHPEPHLMQGYPNLTRQPYTDNVYPTDAVGLEQLRGKIPLAPLNIERR